MSTASRPYRFLLLALLCPTIALGQLHVTRGAIDSIARHAKGVVGVAAIDLGSGDTLTVRGDERFPMQSVYKFPLALAVLDRVDKGTMALAQIIHVSSEDLRPDTWSPLRNTYPAGNIDLPLDSLLAYTVSYSDNNGCDILFRLLGGTGVVNEYIRKLGVANISIVATENEMHQEWNNQYRNWSTPFAMARLLQLFSDGGILSEGSRDYLWRLMVHSGTAPRRIRGQLPPGAVVAHKSGSSGTGDNGVAAATNDIGIMVLPDGRRVALVVFVSDSDAAEEKRDNVIASIAREVWDALSPH